jgi:homoserine O-acetyltransferase
MVAACLSAGVKQMKIFCSEVQVARCFSQYAEKFTSPAVPLGKVSTLHLPQTLKLEWGGQIEGLHVKFASWGLDDPSKPVVLICPSMSNTPYVVDTDVPQPGGGTVRETGWWNHIVGHGSHFGIDLDRFAVVCPSPLGSPFGSTSPREWEQLILPFPRVTPRDMAAAHGLLLDALGLDRIHAVVGGSMGGMQALQCAAIEPHRCLCVYAFVCAPLTLLSTLHHTTSPP